MEGDQISLPYVIVMVVISGLIIHYLFFSGPDTGRSSQSRESALRTREAAAEMLQQMFPQIDRRTILWDLQRSGGSAQATSERILAGRIETPPVSFQPPPPLENVNQIRGAGSSQGGRTDRPKPVDKQSQPSLITRYNLAERLAVGGASDLPDSADQAVPASSAVSQKSGTVGRTTVGRSSGGGGWSSVREEREATLRRRRDEMILAARRKLEAKIAAEGT